jgi:hypothetical protein
MSKTLQEILAGLPEEERGIVIADREAAVNAEKAKGIAEAKKARDNVAGILSKKDAVDAVLTELGLDPDADNLTDAIRELKKSGGKESPEWKKEMVKVQKEIATLKAENAAEKESNLQLRKSGALAKAGAFLKGKIFAHDENAFKLFMDGAIVVKEDGSVVYNTATGEVELEKGLSEYVKTRADIAINTSNGGGGSSGGNGGKGKRIVTQAEFLAMSGKEQGKIILDPNVEVKTT